MTYERENRFAAQTPKSGVESGYEDVTGKEFNRGYIKRNLRSYAKTSQPIRRAIKTDFRSIKGKNYAQLERMATMAVIKRAGVKRRKLRTRINRQNFKPSEIQAARRKMAQGYDIRDRSLGQRGLGIGQIQGKRVRRATAHLARVRRARRVMKSPLWKGRGYDIWKGHAYR